MLQLILPRSAKHAFIIGTAYCLLFQAGLFGIAAVAEIKFTWGGDQHDGYLELAQNVLDGNGYVFTPGGLPCIHRPPLYPAVLTCILRLPESAQRLAIVLLQSTFVGGLAAIAFFNARFWFNVGAGSIAAVLVIANPWLSYAAKNPVSGLLQALLYGICFTLLTVAVLGNRDCAPIQIRKKLIAGLIIGVVGGALLLAHGTALLSFPLALCGVGAVALIKRQPKALAVIPVALVTAAIVVAPWTYRNWQVTGKFLPVVGNAGLNYFLGLQHWEANSIAGDETKLALELAGMDTRLENHVKCHGFFDLDAENQVNERMRQHMSSHPGTFLKKTALDATEFYFPASWNAYQALVFKDRGTLAGWRMPVAISLFYLTLWAMVIVGFFRRPKSNWEWTGYVVLFGAVLCWALPFFPIITYIAHATYTYGTMPFLAALASAAWRTKATSESTRQCELVASE